jgi:hypothetical protein
MATLKLSKANRANHIGLRCIVNTLLTSNSFGQVRIIQKSKGLETYMWENKVLFKWRSQQIVFAFLN